MTTTEPRFSRRNLLAGGCSALAWAAFAPPPRAAALTTFKPSGNAQFHHGSFDHLLQSYVKTDRDRYNRVDYCALQREGGDELKRYIAALLIVEHYPQSSMKDIKLGGLFKSGPWSKKIHQVHGTDLSLDDIEHRIVQALFQDPMSHYGLNCASYSCPNLASRAYTGEILKAALAQGARDYINRRRGVDVSNGIIAASKIYSWYADDFLGEGGLKAHWKSFATPEVAERFDAAPIESYTHDWSLNNV